MNLRNIRWRKKSFLLLKYRLFRKITLPPIQRGKFRKNLHKNYKRVFVALGEAFTYNSVKLEMKLLKIYGMWKMYQHGVLNHAE